VNTPHITTISPSSGAVGASVTINGNGFGASQGSAVVWLGSLAGQVTSWTNTQIVATVAPGSVSGVAWVEQNDQLSNMVTFTVPGGSVTLVPNVINMMVGDTHSIQALNSSGQSVTGLTWTSSNTNVVTLSTDDPPILTAAGVGHSTITAGGASANVTVFPAVATGLPLGTVLWSNPGDGSGITSIIPAVPSPGGVADIFAIQSDGMVDAITMDGTTGWSADASGAINNGLILPDFQGGLLLLDASANSITKLDGITGQAYPAFTPTSGSIGGSYSPYGMVVHTDGTVFTVQVESDSTASVIGIDPITGTEKFSVPFPNQGAPYTNTLMIAGDGFAYVAYSYGGPFTSTFHLHLLRVNTLGQSDDIAIQDIDLPPPYNIVNASVGMITNADTGVLVTWSQQAYYLEARPGHPAPKDSFLDASHYGVAITTGTSVSSTSGSGLPPNGFITPVLQAQDGSFVGTVQDQNISGQTDMVGFDSTGNVHWTVPDEQPQFATADGGVTGASGTTYDPNGSATGLVPTLSGGQVPGWLGNVLGTAYSLDPGTLFQKVAPNTNYANTFTAFLGANATGGRTAIKWVLSKLEWSMLDPLKQLPAQSVAPICYPLPLLGFPTCGNLNAIELQTAQTPDEIFQTLLRTFAGATNGHNSIMNFTQLLPLNNKVNVSGPDQIIGIQLQGFPNSTFAVGTERFDPVEHIISVVTLLGHLLSGWRYWHVYSIGTNDIVIETGGYDQPGFSPLMGPGLGTTFGLVNYAGYYIAQGTVRKSWMEYLQYIKKTLGAPQGTHINTSLGTPPINFRSFPPGNGPILNGYWDYFGDFTGYILNNVCQSTTWCN
jgi:IPT/TIG domain